MNKNIHTNIIFSVLSCSHGIVLTVYNIYFNFYENFRIFIISNFDINMHELFVFALFLNNIYVKYFNFVKIFYSNLLELICRFYINK